MFTYGWAFLSILVAIGVLASFGVFDAGRFRSQECNFPPGAFCEDFTVSDDVVSGNVEALSFIVQNTYGADVVFDSVAGAVTADSSITGPITCLKANDPDAVTYTTAAIESTTWDNEERIGVVCPLPANTFFARENYDFTVTMQFQQQGVAGFTYTVTGLVQARSNP